MIKSIEIGIKERGYLDPLVLILDNPEASHGFAVLSADGLGPGSANVNNSSWATIDGAHVENVILPNRTITMNIRFIEYYEGSGNEQIKFMDVETIRTESYRYFPIKKEVRITFETHAQGKTRRRYVDAIVQKNEPNIWSDTEGCSLSFFCADPHLYDEKDTEKDFSQIKPLFHFQFPDETAFEPGAKMPIAEWLKYATQTITNNSTIDTGVEFFIEAVGGDVVRPMIYNETTRESMVLDYRLRPGEVIVIDTRPGHKSIHTADARSTNKLQYLMLDSKWIKLLPGDNELGTHADKGGEHMRTKYRVRNIHQGL